MTWSNSPSRSWSAVERPWASMLRSGSGETARASAPEGAGDLLRRCPSVLEAGDDILQLNLESVDLGFGVTQLGQEFLIERHGGHGSRGPGLSI